MTQLTDADYQIDMETLLLSMGIEPGTVATDTAKVQFLDGKAVLTYTAMRAIPTRVLGVALLRSAGGEPEQEPVPVKQPTDRRPAKKTTGRRPAKKVAK